MLEGLAWIVNKIEISRDLGMDRHQLTQRHALLRAGMWLTGFFDSPE